MKNRTSKRSSRAIQATPSKKNLPENLMTINKMLSAEDKSVSIVPDKSSSHKDEKQNAIISEVKILNEP
jgi:hypothetical protein